MDDANGTAFEVLEDKVKKATELVRKLRKDNDQLHAELDQLKPRLVKAEKQITEAEHDRKSSADETKRAGELSAEVASLRKDREEVSKRVLRLVHLLESLEG